MSGVLCAIAAGGVIGVNTVTVGTYTDTFTGEVIWGYTSSLAQGSINPTAWPVNGNTVLELYHSNISGSTALLFQVSGSVPNAGWSSININGNIFLRSSAGYNNFGGSTQWDWSPATNPFGTTVGATIEVIWS